MLDKYANGEVEYDEVLGVLSTAGGMHIESLDEYLVSAYPELELMHNSKLSYEAALNAFKESELLAVCESEFYPIFIGVNTGYESTEHKLYFISDISERRFAGIEAMTETLFSAEGLSGAISFQDLNRLNDMGLFVDGISISFDNVPTWRLYWNITPIAKRKIQNGIY